MKICEQIMVIVLAVILILGGIYFIPKWLTPQASHVFYWCQERKEFTKEGKFKGSNNKLAYPRTARIYPAIKDMSYIKYVEYDLEQNTGCSIASIQSWQNVDCRDCGKEVEIKKLENELDKSQKEIQRLAPLEAKTSKAGLGRGGK
ncbi:MAG: hypothetical protein ABSC54_00720 [Smithellaceae bacterium]|jgi:hypothetical protein